MIYLWKPPSGVTTDGDGMSPVGLDGPTGHTALLPVAHSVNDVGGDRVVQVRQDVVVERHHNTDPPLRFTDEQRRIVGIGETDGVDAGLSGGTRPAVVRDDQVRQ